MNPEVVIIGGGPAGLSAGVALADYGVCVLICEAGADPGTKPCGEGLLPAALRELVLLGVDETELWAAGVRLSGVRYLSAAGQCADGFFSGRQGLGLRRSALQRLLRALAGQKTTLHWLKAEARVVQQANGRLGVRVDGTVLNPRLIIGADGLNSRARQAAGLAFRRLPPFRYGLRRHFRVARWTDQVEVYWSEKSEAYVTPVASDEINVAVLWRDEAAEHGHRRSGAPDLAGTFPLLARRLAGATAAQDARGYGPLRVDVAEPARDGLVLLGDAAGYVDAITGEGVGLAVAKARALAHFVAPALRSAQEQLRLSDLRPYLAEARRLERHHVLLTGLLLRLRQSPGLLERTIAALASDPQLFRHFLAANQGEVSPFRLPPRSALGLVRHLTGRAFASKTSLESHALRD